MKDAKDKEIAMLRAHLGRLIERWQTYNDLRFFGMGTKRAGEAMQRATASARLALGKEQSR